MNRRLLAKHNMDVDAVVAFLGESQARRQAKRQEKRLRDPADVPVSNQGSQGDIKEASELANLKRARVSKRPAVLLESLTPEQKSVLEQLTANFSPDRRVLRVLTKHEWNFDAALANLQATAAARQERRARKVDSGNAKLPRGFINLDQLPAEKKQAMQALLEKGFTPARRVLRVLERCGGQLEAALAELETIAARRQKRSLKKDASERKIRERVRLEDLPVEQQQAVEKLAERVSLPVRRVLREFVQCDCDVEATLAALTAIKQRKFVRASRSLPTSAPASAPASASASASASDCKNKDEEKLERLRLRQEKKAQRQIERQDKKAQREAERQEKKVQREAERQANLYPVVTLSRYTLEAFPSQYRQIFLDGNNMLYVINDIRSMALGRNVSKAEAALGYIASRTASVLLDRLDASVNVDQLSMSRLDLNDDIKTVPTCSMVLLFDRVSERRQQFLQSILSSSSSVLPTPADLLRVCSAAPDFETSDDLLVHWAEQQKQAGTCGSTLYVTSDRGLSRRLHALDAAIMKPKEFFKFSAGVLAHDQSSNDAKSEDVQPHASDEDSEVVAISEQQPVADTNIHDFFPRLLSQHELFSNLLRKNDADDSASIKRSKKHFGKQHD